MQRPHEYDVSAQNSPSPVREGPPWIPDSCPPWPPARPALPAAMLCLGLSACLSRPAWPANCFPRAGPAAQQPSRPSHALTEPCQPGHTPAALQGRAAGKRSRRWPAVAGIHIHITRRARVELEAWGKSFIHSMTTQLYLHPLACSRHRIQPQMSSKQISPLLQTWYKWKALRLPWRKRFLVGTSVSTPTTPIRRKIKERKVKGL